MTGSPRNISAYFVVHDHFEVVPWDSWFRGVRPPSSWLWIVPQICPCESPCLAPPSHDYGGDTLTATLPSFTFLSLLLLLQFHVLFWLPGVFFMHLHHYVMPAPPLLCPQIQNSVTDSEWSVSCWAMLSASNTVALVPHRQRGGNLASALEFLHFILWVTSQKWPFLFQKNASLLASSFCWELFESSYSRIRTGQLILPFQLSKTFAGEGGQLLEDRAAVVTMLHPFQFAAVSQGVVLLQIPK